MANWAKLQEDTVGLPLFKRAKHGIHFKQNDGSILANFSGKPSCRILYILFENRNTIIEPEQRNIFVYDEERDYTIGSEDRIFNIISCTDGGSV